ncbi:hypothetical protein AMATHDRAFT_4185 [Amanita thiersii Skay4041]|uniref:Uncharacterized protein n=1 Tax=Amanita thiersii Skay4041 TaxID=703135 RepID=A0A2A9NHU7_9AGAR|nr:hypothetical protein AMATHDRAFT_4185 [Amanita thiersii Skay4041]
MSVVKKLFSRKLKPTYPPNSTVHVPPNLLRSDWLADILKIARIAAAASDLAPFPYIKGAVNVFIALLEPIQQLKKNKEDFRELAEEVCKLIILLRDRAVKHQTTIAASPEFAQLCIDFGKCMLDIQAEMNELIRQQSVRWKGYWKANVVQDLIQRYKSRIESLRLNFMMLNVFDMRVQLSNMHLVMDNQNKQSQTTSEGPLTVQRVQPQGLHIDLDISDYKQVNLGDIQVLTEPLIRQRGGGLAALFTEDSIVCIESSRKTFRTYRGDDHLQVLREDFKIKSQFKYIPPLLLLFVV